MAINCPLFLGEMMIYIPELGYEITSEEFAAYRAAKEYDERLVFAYNPAGDDYVISIKTDQSDGMPPLKRVLGFGRECPNPDQIKKALYESDGWRHGDRVLREMDEREKIREKRAAAYREALAEEAAERIEHAMRTRNDTDGPTVSSPITKSLPK